LSRASIDRMRRIFTNALRVASIPVGGGVGLWTAQLQMRIICTSFSCPAYTEFPRFALGLCALLGAAAAALTVLVSTAARRPAGRRTYARPSLMMPLTR
jgi:hypothetical protein